MHHAGSLMRILLLLASHLHGECKQRTDMRSPCVGTGNLHEFIVAARDSS